MNGTTELSLNGNWAAHRRDEEQDIFPARVPGCIHLDLLHAGTIPEPFYRDNENRVLWVGETDWTFRREFSVPPELLQHDNVILQCEGLDTLAEVWLNGQCIGRADNMFRRWEFAIRDNLKAGENTLEIRFTAPVPVGRKKQEEYFLWHTGIGHHRLSGGNWLRKEQCNFGWDWGPMLATCGIWRSIQIIAWNGTRLSGTRVEQQHHSGGVDLTCHPHLDGPADGLQIRAQLRDEESIVASATGPANQPLVLRVENPRLWWPHGLGKQPLYTLDITLQDESGEPRDSSTLTIGLRQLELIQEEDDFGQSFTFAINGHRFFAKGANWIPAHVFDGAITREQLRDLLQSAADANMNMLRVWGGGKYESEDFYDLCDELGLLVWQDFMFGCSAYPAHDPDFMENVRIEVEEQVTRLQHRTCLALWCGNNELEQIQEIIGDRREAGQMSWEHYRALFDDLIGGVVRNRDPQRPYIPSSEHSPRGDRLDSGNPRCGDAHLWAVWHGREPFEWYRTSFHRFCSEFGFQSFPHPETVRSYTVPEERNITSYVMEHHQRSPIGNSAIIDYLLSWFRFPVGWENSIWLSQVVQAYAIKYAVEHWRRQMPCSMGALYWQLNDCWPVASWASIDSANRWKALHYEARRFFAPVLVSLVEDLKHQTVAVYLSNDRRDGVSGEWVVRITDLEGTILSETKEAASVAAGSSSELATLSCAGALTSAGPRGILVWAHWMEDGEVVSSNLATFARPKHLELPNPELTLQRDGEDWIIKAQHPALFVWLEGSDANTRYSDNFFHLEAGATRKIKVLRGDSASTPRLRSLFDTYQE